jgi:tetratricopeptide (TPR) repeat protein
VIFCLRSFALLLSAVLIAVLLRPVVSGYYATRSSGNPLSNVLKASKITDEDARYHYLLGLLYQKRNDDDHLSEATDSYQRSLERDPTRAFTWLALSKTHKGHGEQKWAQYAVQKAVSVDRANPKITWEAGMLYLTEGQPQEAAPYFKKYLALVPAEQEEIYTMFHALGTRPAFMLGQVLPEEYPFYNRYFRFLVAYKQHAALGEAWERRKLWRPAHADYLAYCDFLIETGRVPEAQGVWSELVPHICPSNNVLDLSNMIFNGDFESPLQNGCFDWRIGNADGVLIFADKDIKKSGRSSLAVRFSGKTNPGIYVAKQVVAVRQKQRYRVSGQVRTDRLTTQNGVLLEVLGQDCPSLAIRSEVVTGTNDWRLLDLEFTTPAACSLIYIGVKREHSEKFDNKISGDVWLDEFKMTEVNDRAKVERL